MESVSNHMGRNEGRLVCSIIWDYEPRHDVQLWVRNGLDRYAQPNWAP